MLRTANSVKLVIQNERLRLFLVKLFKKKPPSIVLSIH